jgi:cell division protein FtsW
MVIPTTVWERLGLPLLLLAFVFLVIVLIPGIGHEVNGSRRWLRAGFMNFQASELARVLLLTYLASYVVRKQAELKQDLKGFLKPLGVLMGAALLLLLEPDFGAATVIMATGLAVLFLAGVKLRHFLALVLLAAGGMALIAVTSAYRLKRLTAFMDPWADPFNSGFQLTQSLIAIGRGELFGVGLGSSVQKLFYLPEAHTDFVFAVLAEELGLVGVVVTLALFVMLAWRAFHIARQAAEAGLPFQAYFASGFGLWLGLQTFINIGVNLGLLPTKGLTLPLMSYGGSSILVTLGWLGVLMRIHHEASVAGKLAVPRRERAQ